MITEELKVLLGAYDNEGNCLIYFDLIEGVQCISSEELDAQIKDSFLIFTTYSYTTRNKEVTCKFMFINHKELEKTYTTWGTDNKILPYSQKSMSSIYKYLTSGEIIEIYE